MQQNYIHDTTIWARQSLSLLGVGWVGLHVSWVEEFYKSVGKRLNPNTVGFRPVISLKAKCEFITLKHNSMNVYIN